MSTDGNKATIAIARRVFVAGLILLVIWLMLFALRSAIPKSSIDMLNQSGAKVSYDSSTWDWTKSLINHAPISQEIGKRMPVTLQMIGLAVLFSLFLLQYY